MRPLTLLLGLLAALYPLAVYLGLSYWSAQAVVPVLLALFSLRWILGRSSPGPQHTSSWVAAAGVGLMLVALVLNTDLPLRVYPVVVNATLLALFGYSLWRGPSVAERIARLTQPDLPAEGVRYCRQVTLCWCLFFLLNGSLALYTSLWASLELWTLYNGLIAYLLIGTLAGAEWLYRRRRLGSHQ
ncbi:hypothetical protein [Aestuariirhabdus litorea]|uniref:DNA gyrase subunit B n=1 Tax=Aestuariirhabdus litorea TaxID=2528527 RepID=A0A3P3VJB3_9GAMM|nr:hypothetical protein [Aestuariirhabdus litorea]RRJ82780.1 DNA gyrase subunit B [Aestuariirhabdus litorea]RWW92940.1 DNA gyrase subunit B [Endozoicomonadaceae bacterium GTF-13]